MRELALLAAVLAGGVGAILRLLVSAGASKFPIGILLANTIASLIAGLIAFGTIDQTLALILAVGFAGGLSTFSTFAAQSAELIRQRNWMLAGVNILLNLTLPVSAALLGANLALALLK